MNITKLKRKHIIWGHIIFWVVELFIGFSFYIFSPDKVPASYYWGRVMSSAVWMIAFYISYLVFIPIITQQGKTGFKISKILAIYIIYLFVDILYLKFMRINYFEGEPLKFGRYFLNAFTYSTSYMIMGAIFRLAINGFKSMIQKSQLEKQNLKSELALLRSQINPHFLFNTLNNMHSFTHIDPDKTAFSIIKLSEIMRYMLHESNSEKVLLDQEIDYLKSYIALQNLRFSDTEFVHFNIIGDSAGVEIAPMIFIPFVENAFKHSDKKQKDKGIKIELKISDSKIIFEVCNIKRKIKSEDIEDSNGFGITNLRRRLELAYPEKYKLDIQDEKERYLTRLEINMRNEN